MNRNRSGISGIEGNRAMFAYEKVREIVEKHDDININKGDYKSYVRRIPMLIQTNGLGATFAFVKSKSNSKDSDNKAKAYKVIYDQISEWIRVDEKQIIELKENEDLIEKIIQIPSSTYRALTLEILSLFNWLKRFADGMIEDDNNSKSTSDKSWLIRKKTQTIKR